jgi:hypothetical protein
MNIHIETISHGKQKYATVGDWWFDEFGNLEIRVSDLKNIMYEWLVAEHEINEALECKKLGIKPEDLDDYDIKFEALRSTAPEVIGEQEPGDMVAAPYYKQHQDATAIEQLSAKLHGVNWHDYTLTVESVLNEDAIIPEKMEGGENNGS